MTTLNAPLDGRPDQAKEPAPPHPLNPLSGAEIAETVRILRDDGAAGESTRFITVTLDEPHKDVFQALRSGEMPDRRALVVLLDNSNGATHELVVSLTRAEVVKREHIPGVQPAIVLDEFFECEDAVKKDPRFQQALAKRGITDFDLLMIDPWSAGNYGDEHESRLRLARTLAWVRPAAGENGYAHPVEGLLAWVDLNTMAVVKLEDNGVVPIPQQPGHYAARHFEGAFREPPKPLEIEQPAGPTFAVDGNLVQWLGWSFRVGFTAREGLVLHQIGYRDGERLRSIMHRASVSEMVVPYGDPHINFARRNAFDVGEYGIGLLTNSLQLGCDCVGLIRYFDADVVASSGDVMKISNAVCLHEEDAGMLWKHTDWRTEEVEVRRSRRLVVSSVATVGNYEYGFFWYLYLDGTIQFEVKMSGVLNTGALPPGETRKYGRLVAPGLYAAIHQHIFNLRLDMALEGSGNSVYEVDTKAEPMGPENPFGNAYFAQARLLETEQNAARDIDPASARYWKICNPNVSNALGEPVAYKLMPGENAFPFVDPRSSVRRRAGFMNHHLWVTQYAPDELYAAGNYPNQSDPRKDHGLPAYIKQNRSIENNSLTLWYTMNIHHEPRLEDWPVMPAAASGFHLKPAGFFDRNPAISLPPTPSKGSKNAAGGCCT